MKGIINILISSALLLLAVSCQEHLITEIPMNEGIVLDISSSQTKAVSGVENDTDVESFVNHIDVFFFNSEEVGGNLKPSTVKAYERLNVNDRSQMTLSTGRSTFDKDAKYFVYIVANSTFTSDEFSAISSFNELLQKKQEDQYLHLTGLSIDNAPKHFLMDAVAVGEASEKAIVINNGVPSDNTVLYAELRRAAAKVFINIEASDAVEFKSFTIAQGSEGGLYYVRNLPYDAYLLAEANTADKIEAKVRITAKTDSEYFSWHPDMDNKNVTLVTYVYPNHWIDDSVLEHETCVVMNLPMIFTDNNSVAHEYYNSWYKIPVTADQTLERNRYYEVNIKLDRPGAISESQPVTVEDLHYSVLDWIPQTISVGGEDKPKYLSVNETAMEMHNIAQDATTLKFASSSPVTITVKDVYYYNKFGQKTTVSSNITRDMNGVTDGGISGNITVNSPVPENNAIRYFTLVITNEDGFTREVKVTQYPLEYITNIQSYYSYRTDFMTTSSEPTTYLHKGDRIVSASWSNNRWNKSTSTGSNYFFTSKVAYQNYDGTSDIHFYSYSQYSNRPSDSNNTVNGLDNARMYHVQITATSDTYVLGIPKMDENGYTDSGDDNAKLVSPSFMIASQLGAVYASGGDTQSNRERSRTHCKEYAEVYIDEETGEYVELTDWRLPTAAEIGIIVKFQNDSEVMDEVLGGRNYFCASGSVATGITGNNDGYFLRCIRDVY